MTGFSLDLTTNPHPVMRERALGLRRLARMAPREPLVYLRWQGYLEAMCDATGEKPQDINAWLDRYDDPEAIPRIGTSVDAPARRR